MTTRRKLITIPTMRLVFSQFGSVVGFDGPGTVVPRTLILSGNHHNSINSISGNAFILYRMIEIHSIDWPLDRYDID